MTFSAVRCQIERLTAKDTEFAENADLWNNTSENFRT